jgi:hypothetical protein
MAPTGQVSSPRRVRLQPPGEGSRAELGDYAPHQQSPYIRSPNALVARLGGKWSGDTAMCACPAHADRTPSLSVRQGDRGILVTCHAGCDARDVLRELARIEHLPDFRRAIVEKATGGPGEAHLAIWRAANAIEGTLAERYIRDTRGIWAPLSDVDSTHNVREGRGPLPDSSPRSWSPCTSLAKSPRSSGYSSIPARPTGLKSSVSGRRSGRPGPMGLPLEPLACAKGSRRLPPTCR